MTTTIPLHPEESVELVAAWSIHLAREFDIRALIIKGAPLADYGLRKPRVSSDVDIFVDPARFEEYSRLLIDRAWQPMPDTFSRENFILHSRTFRAMHLPTMIDVHHAYPGFLRDETTAFDALWRRRAVHQFAHVDCEVADRVASVVLLALHSIRGSKEQRRHQDELETLLAADLRDDERDAIAEFAREVGSTVPLAEILPKLGVIQQADAEEQSLPTYQEWRRKVAASHGGAVSWLSLLSRSSLREWPKIVARAVWPPREDLLANSPDVADRRISLIFARVRRWRRGLAQLPASAREYLRRS